MEDLIVRHVAWCCTEFSVALDNLVDRFQEIFFRGNLAAGADSKHASLGTHRPVIWGEYILFQSVSSRQIENKRGANLPNFSTSWIRT